MIVLGFVCLGLIGVGLIADVSWHWCFEFALFWICLLVVCCLGCVCCDFDCTWFVLIVLEFAFAL